MKLIITENYEEMSKIAASYFISEASKGYEKESTSQLRVEVLKKNV